MKVTVEGGKNLETNLAARLTKYGSSNPVVVVGFTQKYAIYVHEVAAYHKVGQWKYLETPARQLRSALKDIIKRALAAGTTMEQALLLAGLRLQRAAQQLTPVDTSALKASAFTCLQRDLEATSQSAFSKSEAIRTGAKP